MSKAGFRQLDLQAVRADLDQHATRLGQREDVLAVVLFGSLATGGHSGSSDADLMVIVRASDQPFLDRAAEFMEPGLPLPVDVFVYTAAELQRAIAGANPFVRRALTEGVPLFLRIGYRLPGRE